MSDRDRDELIEAIKEMAEKCHLENWEQIADNGSAIGAVRRIQREYLWQIKGDKR